MIGMATNGKRDGDGAAARLPQQTAAIGHAVVEEAGEKIAAGAELLREVGTTLAERARQRLPEVKERTAPAGAAIGQAAHTVGEQLGAATQTGAERAREVSSRVTSDLIPSLREIAVQAGQVALERWEAARARAEETQRQTADTVGARAGHGLETAEETLARAQHAAEDLLHQAQRAAEEILSRARNTAAAAAHAATDQVERAETAVETGVERAKHAQDAARREAQQVSRKAAETGNDALGFLFWGAAAAAIVWYVLLNPRRRQQLETLGRTAWNEGHQLWRDVRGEDEQF